MNMEKLRGNIRTGYFAKADTYKKLGYTLISIARYTPKGIDCVKLNAFMPPEALLRDYKAGKVSWEEYDRVYTNHINSIPVETSLNALSNYMELDGKDKAVLLCFEKDPENCHRSLLAGILNEKYDLGIEEFDVEKEKENVTRSCVFLPKKPRSLLGITDHTAYQPMVDEIYDTVSKLYKEYNVKNFYTDASQGFSQLAFWAIQKFKKENPDAGIKNIVFLLPDYMEKISGWPEDDVFGQKETAKLLRFADKTLQTKEMQDYEKIVKSTQFIIATQPSDKPIEEDNSVSAKYMMIHKNEGGTGMLVIGYGVEKGNDMAPRFKNIDTGWFKTPGFVKKQDAPEKEADDAMEI